jgi:hypothetical protein
MPLQYPAPTTHFPVKENPNEGGFFKVVRWKPRKDETDGDGNGGEEGDDFIILLQTFMDAMGGGGGEGGY